MVRAEGGRLLAEGNDRWTENAWDHVSWSLDHEKLAQEAIAKQQASPVPTDQQAIFNSQPASFWDQIYTKVTDTMYKDRSWLQEEFPDLAQALRADVLAELGCGPGNTAFPLMARNENPLLQLYALDFSNEAIDMVRKHPAYNPAQMTASVWDVADPAGLPPHIQAGSVDTVICIFVLSALHPAQWEQTVANIHQMLKPGGILLFRDYGRHDLVQLRFKKARLMQDNLYVRGDGTRVYFFEERARDDLCQRLTAVFRNPKPRGGSPFVTQSQTQVTNVAMLGARALAQKAIKEGNVIRDQEMQVGTDDYSM